MANTSSPIVLTVSELTYAIKSQLEPLFRRVSVRGEVANLRKQHSGHIYFSLIEGSCQINAVFFRGNASALSFPLKQGDSIIAYGELSVYPPKGTYQLIVREMSPVGLGEALLKLQALKKKLQDLGWFSLQRKRPLPKEIQKIGLVTSPTGAVLHDIINILTRRVGAFHLIVNPVRVQGEGASLEIARAIREFSQYPLADVIIVCRGGGSAEDLSAFNDETVAEACFQSKIPLISAIGHETDLSITDLVADLRAPTPSAAAELVSQARLEKREKTHVLKEHISRALKNSLRLVHTRINSFAQQINQASPLKQLELISLRLDDIEEALLSKIRHDLVHKKTLLAHIAKTIETLHPQRTLERGYAIVFRGDEVVRSIKQVQAKDSLRIRVADGECFAHIHEEAQ